MILIPDIIGFIGNFPMSVLSRKGKFETLNDIGTFVPISGQKKFERYRDFCPDIGTKVPISVLSRKGYHIRRPDIMYDIGTKVPISYVLT